MVSVGLHIQYTSAVDSASPWHCRSSRAPIASRRCRPRRSDPFLRPNCNYRQTRARGRGFRVVLYSVQQQSGSTQVRICRFHEHSPAKIIKLQSTLQTWANKTIPNCNSYVVYGATTPLIRRCSLNSMRQSITFWLIYQLITQIASVYFNWPHRRGRSYRTQLWCIAENVIIDTDVDRRRRVRVGLVRHAECLQVCHFSWEIEAFRHMWPNHAIFRKMF